MNKFKVNLSFLLISVAMLSMISCENNESKKSENQWPSILESKSIAEEGFIYGLPLVMNYAVMYEYSIDKNSGQFKAPLNHLKSMPNVYTWKDTAVVTPNSDTPYSMGFMDLRAEPIVISVPEIDKSRYYSIQLEDGNAFNYGYIGSRTTGNDAGNYMIVGPSWKGEKPEGINKVFTASTQFSISIIRTQLFGPDDINNVIKVQEGYKMQPLSSFLNTKAPNAAPKINFPVIDKDSVKKDFFNYLDFVLQFAPAGPEEKEIREKLLKIGVGPGKEFDFNDLPDEHKAEILLGMKTGNEKVEKAISEMASEINGWKISSYFGDRAFYNGNWLMRAAGAKAGIYGNDAEEAAYPMIRNLENGEVIDCSKNNYTITFKEGEFPPVNAFWSITMYDGKSQFLIKNPINRYLINSPMLPELKKGKDGSITIYIQKDSPGIDKESNWLPAPNGPVYMVMRLYWPKTEDPSILPIGKGTWKPTAVVKTN